MTYREFKAELDRLGRSLRELAARTTAESLDELSDDAFAEEVEHFAHLSAKFKRLRAALDAVPRSASNSTS